MSITREHVAEKPAAYLRHEIDQSDLVDWAESAMMDEESCASDQEVIRNTVARLGVLDVRAFELLWEDCEEVLKDLGFTVHLEIVAA